ncbi:MAG: prephenate dehydrogenase, partial [Actinobacteria bacterium]|nr:prephenate dehydrogenase [Actinomycetota bacterium]
MSDSLGSSAPFQRVRIVGSGLIGTSIGLALVSRGVDVDMRDIDPRAELLARDLVKSQELKDPELTIFALPSSSISQALDSEFAINPGSKFIDIG